MIATPHPFIRSRFLVSAMLVALPCAVPAADSFTLASPDGKLGAKVSIRNQELFYQLDFAGKTVLEAARLGMTAAGNPAPGTPERAPTGTTGPRP